MWSLRGSDVVPQGYYVRKLVFLCGSNAVPQYYGMGPQGDPTSATTNSLRSLGGRRGERDFVEMGSDGFRSAGKHHVKALGLSSSTLVVLRVATLLHKHCPKGCPLARRIARPACTSLDFLSLKIEQMEMKRRPDVRKINSHRCSAGVSEVEDVALALISVACYRGEMA